MSGRPSCGHDAALRAGLAARLLLERAGLAAGQGDVAAEGHPDDRPSSASGCPRTGPGGTRRAQSPAPEVERPRVLREEVGPDLEDRRLEQVAGEGRLAARRGRPNGTSYRTLAIRRTCWPSSSIGTTGSRAPGHERRAVSAGMRVREAGHRVDGELVDDDCAGPSSAAPSSSIGLPSQFLGPKMRSESAMPLNGLALTGRSTSTDAPAAMSLEARGATSRRPAPRPRAAGRSGW